MDKVSVNSQGYTETKEVMPKTPVFNLEYWKTFFSPNCVVTLQYQKMKDGTEILVIKTIPENYDINLKPVIFIPGWFSQPSGWLDVILPISEKTIVYYLESREKNSSNIIRSKNLDMSIERMALDLEEVINNEKINIENTIIFGSSLGGSSILQYILNSGKKPYESVLLGPNPNFHLPPVVGPILVRLPLFMISAAKRYVKWHILKFRIDSKKEPEQAAKYVTVLDAAEPYKVGKSAKQVTKFDIWDRLPNVNANIILIGASSDKLHAAERTLKVGLAIPNSRYIDFVSNKAAHSDELGNFIVQIAESKKLDNVQYSSEINLDV